MICNLSYYPCSNVFLNLFTRVASLEFSVNKTFFFVCFEDFVPMTISLVCLCLCLINISVHSWLASTECHSLCLRQCTSLPRLMWLLSYIIRPGISYFLLVFKVYVFLIVHKRLSLCCKWKICTNLNLNVRYSEPTGLSDAWPCCSVISSLRSTLRN